MAYVELTPIQLDGSYTVVSITGITSGTQGTSDGWTLYAQGGRSAVNVWNADVSSHTVTVKTQITENYLTDATETIAAGKSVTIAGFPATQINSSGKVEIDLESSEEEHLYGTAFTFNPTHR